MLTPLANKISGNIPPILCPPSAAKNLHDFANPQTIAYLDANIQHLCWCQMDPATQWKNMYIPLQPGVNPRKQVWKIVHILLFLLDSRSNLFGLYRCKLRHTLVFLLWLGYLVSVQCWGVSNTWFAWYYPSPRSCLQGWVCVLEIPWVPPRMSITPQYWSFYSDQTYSVLLNGEFLGPTKDTNSFGSEFPKFLSLGIGVKWTKSKQR